MLTSEVVPSEGLPIRQEKRLEMLRIFLTAICFSSLGGCSAKAITPELAQEIANDRYKAIARSVDGVVAPISKPAVNVRADDTVYKYIEPRTQRSIIVIVTKKGEFAETIQGASRD